MILPNDPHDKELARLVHPDDWKNPTPAGRYNLVVIGAGTAGLVAAAGAAGLGGKVALIEKHLMGGDCLTVGCVPSKALLSAAHVAHRVRHAGEYGVAGVNSASVDFPQVMERMRRLRAHIAHHDSARRFSDLGVDVYLGEGRFLSSDTIEVGGQKLRFARALIATGGRAVVPPVPGLAETPHLTNENVFTLTELPKRLAVIGGGPIGCEMAQAFARFGSAVTIFDKGKVLLSKEEPEASALLRQVLLREGVSLQLETELISVAVADGAKKIAFKVQDGNEQTLLFDQILVAAGRAPNVEGLGLEAAGVKFDTHKGVKVDGKLTSSNPHIFAAGDVAGHFQFTHAADAMSRMVLRNALFFGRSKLDELVMPWVTYTEPEVARVGQDAAGAKRADAKMTTYTVQMAQMDRAIVEGDTEGFATVHVDGKGHILGATIVARHAGEMITPITLAMTKKLKLSDLGETIFPYPTQTEVLKRVADQSSRARLTPFVKSLLERFLRWRR